jgi:hypothetical protein
VIPASSEARIAEFRIISSSRLFPTRAAQASAAAFDTALELFSPIPTGICESTVTTTKLFFVISFGRLLSIIFLSTTDPASDRNSIPLPFCNSTSTLVFKDVPKADPYPVATALTIEIAP